MVIAAAEEDLGISAEVHDGAISFEKIAFNILNSLLHSAVKLYRIFKIIINFLVVFFNYKFGISESSVTK
jgi:hypothetical protein